MGVLLRGLRLAIIPEFVLLVPWSLIDWPVFLNEVKKGAIGYFLPFIGT